MIWYGMVWLSWEVVSPGMSGLEPIYSMRWAADEV
jgi:hypothetical protein